MLYKISAKLPRKHHPFFYLRDYAQTWYINKDGQHVWYLTENDEYLGDAISYVKELCRKYHSKFLSFKVDRVRKYGQ